MNMHALILTATAAILLPAPASAQDGVKLPPKERVQNSTKKVKELQKERIDALKDLTVAAAKMYQSARMGYTEVIEARVLLFKAELEVADKESDRVALCRQMVGEWKQFEGLAKQRLEAGQGTMVALLRFKAMRLEAEILLEQAQAKTSEVERQKVMATNPQVKDVFITQTYACQVNAQRHINVRSLQNGYLEEIPVKEGQAVKKGDLMFKVVPVLYKAKLDAALAEVKLAELELEHTEKLVKRNVVSPIEADLYKAKLVRAKAKASLAVAELNFTMVRAPFDGIIDRLREQQGSLVTDRNILTTLSDNSVMWVYFNMPEARYLEYMANPGKEKAGKIELVLANGRKFKQTGKLGASEAQFDKDKGSVPFRADFPNPDGLLRHGMTGKVLIQRTLTNVIVIPQRATFEIRDKRYVYVVDKDGVAHQREIVVQSDADGIFVISRGIGVDDRIIVEGIRQVRDGEKVEYEVRPPG